MLAMMIADEFTRALGLDGVAQFEQYVGLLQQLAWMTSSEAKAFVSQLAEEEFAALVCGTKEQKEKKIMRDAYSVRNLDMKNRDKILRNLMFFFFF